MELKVCNPREDVLVAVVKAIMSGNPDYPVSFPLVDSQLFDMAEELDNHIANACDGEYASEPQLIGALVYAIKCYYRADGEYGITPPGPLPEDLPEDQAIVH
jgi:hypothetical protein